METKGDNTDNSDLKRQKRTIIHQQRVEKMETKCDNTDANDDPVKSDTEFEKSHFCGVCNITFVKSTDLKLHKAMLHQKEVERIDGRDRPRFFDQVGHQTTNASIGNKHFFTK